MGTSGTQLGRVPPGVVEHRLFPRTRVLHPVSIELPSGKTLWLHDLAMCGLRVRGGSILEVGTGVSVRFRLPQAESDIAATGIVIWSDDEGRSGIRFSEMQSDSHSALRKWLESAHSPANPKISAPQDSVLESRIACLGEVSELQGEIASRQLDAAAALDLIVRRMMELTRATGAAIALREDENVICRASAGNAPDVGVKLSLSSLSGGCFRTGAMVLLNDSENDPRVDPVLCRQLNFRSLLILPISLKSEIVGIAEVLSPNPHNFEGGEVLVISFLSDLIAGIAAPKELHDAPESTLPDILETLGEDGSGAPDGAGLITAQQPAFDLGQQAQTSDPFCRDKISALPLVDEPKISVRSEHASLSVQDSVVTAARVQGSSSLSSSPAIPTAAAVIRGDKSSILDIASRYSDGREPRRTAWTVSIAAAIVGVLISAGLLFSYHRRTGAVSGPTIPAPALSTSTQGVSKLPVNSTIPVAATQAASTSMKAAAAPAPEPKPRRSEITKPQSVDDTPAELRVIAGKSAKPNPNPAIENAPEAPQIAQLAGNSLNSLAVSVVSAKTPNPQLQVRQSQGVTGGKLLKRVLPRYPDEARRAGISGDVVMAGTIGIDGRLHNLKVITGSPVLRGEALEAARQWRYEPAMLSGKPVETDTRITISFRHQ